MSASVSASSAPLASASASSSAEPARVSFASLALSPEQFDKRTLYAWMSATKEKELRASRRLPRIARGPKVLGELFDATLMADKDPTSKALRHALRDAELGYRRSAWPVAYATSLGALGDAKGERLARISLAPDAVIGRYTPSSTPRWSFLDGQGKSVAASEIIAHPERLGAVLHVAPPRAAKGSAPALPAIREYVLCNEAQIVEVSVASAEQKAALSLELSALSSLSDTTDSDEAWGSALVLNLWASPAEAPSELDLYGTSLASSSAAYKPSAETRANIIAALEGAMQAPGEPFSFSPAAQAAAAASAASAAASASASAPQLIKPPCAMHGDQEKCNPLPPANRFAHDGRWCVDPLSGRMIACSKR